jgi:NhaP-type Na+/H+ or K+/H+ antiporter
MSNFVGFVVRLIVGVASLIVGFWVLDAIGDRSTEIIVACIGLSYCFIFVISRRWQYYGLSAVSIFGMTVAWVNSEPFDQGARQPLRMPMHRSFVLLSIVFASLMELLCAYRLLTSLIGHGWDRLAGPLRPLLDRPELHVWLDRL